MKKTHVSMFLLGVILASATMFNLYADINFGSRQSALRVSEKGVLHVSAPSFTVDGTLAHDTGGTIEGASVIFNGGILERNGIGALLSHDAEFVPSASAFILKNGNIACYNTLTNDLTLNSGTLTLDSDLALADNIRLLGPGTLNLNGHQLTLGGYYADNKTWDTSLTFTQATSIYLTGLTKLGSNGRWTFPGTSRVNGNGETLDLSAGGKITIGANQKLYLEDITISGLSNDSIVFGSGTSELHLSNATLIIKSDVTVNNGRVVVDGSSTVVHKGYNLVFTSNGSLIVNGSVLWLESLDSVTYPHLGHLRFTVGSNNYDVYDANGYNKTNVDSAVAAGLLFLNDEALIKQTVSQSEYNATEMALLGGNLTTDISMLRNLTLNQDQAINVNGNVTINGSGATIVFTDAANAQIVIANNKTLTLRNITLSRLNSRTFLFGTNAHLRIGENVIFELADNLTFTSNTAGTTTLPLITVLDGDGEANSFLVRGMIKQRVLEFEKPARLSGSTIYQRPIKLGDNILCLESVACKKLDISVLTPNVDNVPEYPEVVLRGKSSLDLYGKKKDENNANLVPYSSVDILVEGTENRLFLLRDGIDYGGMITFGSLTENELTMQFDIQNLATGRKVHGYAVKDGYPYMVLSGTGIGVYSPLIEGSDPVRAEGSAILKIENNEAAIEINDPDAFQIDTGAQFTYKNLQLLNNQIKQNSTGAIIGGKDSRREGDIDITGILLSGKKHRKSIKDRRKLHTQELAKRMADELEQTRLMEEAALKEDTQTAKKELSGFEQEDAVINRTLSLPVTLDGPTKVNVYENLKTAFTGKFEFDGSILNNFVTFINTGAVASDYAPFNLVLANNNKVYLAAQDMKLYRKANLKSESQLINITGKGNEIHVNRKLTVINNLFLGAGSELTFVFDNDGSATPTVVLDAGTKLELEKNAILRFSGRGKVVLANNVLVYFRGTKPTKAPNFATNKPRFVLTDGATLDFATNANVNFSGYGTIEITNGAKLAPTTTGNLNIGYPMTYAAAISIEKDPTYTPVPTPGLLSYDDMDLLVSNNGEIRLDLPTSISGTGVARVGIQQAKSQISFEQGGMLTVGNKGVFNINSDTRPTPSLVKPGALRMLSFGYCGKLWIKAGGEFAIGSNTKATQEMTTWNGLPIIKSQELPFIWYATQSTMCGAGTVQYPAAKATNSKTGTFTPTSTSLQNDSTAILASTLMGYMGAK